MTLLLQQKKPESKLRELLLLQQKQKQKQGMKSKI
jgi:hypothetical protein